MRHDGRLRVVSELSAGPEGPWEAQEARIRSGSDHLQMSSGCQALLLIIVLPFIYRPGVLSFVWKKIHWNSKRTPLFIIWTNLFFSWSASRLHVCAHEKLQGSGAGESGVSD